MTTHTIIWIVIFWTSVTALFHSYVLFPFLLNIIAGKKTKPAPPYYTSSDAPSVSVLISVFNEEEVIEAKIRSIFNTTYPLEKLHVIIGSDCSTDNTNNIIEKLKSEFTNLFFFPFSERQGKPNVINKIFAHATGEIIILTDANVMLEPSTIPNLIRHYRDEKVGLVDTNMVNFGVKKDGISLQEKAYLSREVMIKHHESVLWGAMIGPFGGCYSIRKSLYTPVPSNFLVDDFYINMQVLRKSYRAINDVEAVVHEDVSNNLKVEFRRKVRIATGNFQNLMTFAGMLWPPFTGKAFSFFSHKVLRWKGPFFILMAIISSAFIAAEENCFYFISLAGIVFLLLLPLLDALLKKFGIHIILLRFITHFVSMNIALLFGFLKFLKGVRTNVWKPTKRNQ